MRRGFGRVFGRRRMFMPFRRMFWWPRLFLWGGFMYLLFGSMMYKVRRDDATVIERDSGKQVKDMTEEELVAAMKRLGIKSLEISDDERATVERNR